MEASQIPVIDSFRGNVCTKWHCDPLFCYFASDGGSSGTKAYLWSLPSSQYFRRIRGTMRAFFIAPLQKTASVVAYGKQNVSQRSKTRQMSNKLKSLSSWIICRAHSGGSYRTLWKDRLCVIHVSDFYQHISWTIATHKLITAHLKLLEASLVQNGSTVNWLHKTATT